MVHVSTNEFKIKAKDWTGDLHMVTSMKTSIRYFNLNNSYFEPLMDPWQLNMAVERRSISSGVNPLSVKFSAAERLELNLTSAFIELAITTMTVWNKEGDRVKQGRGSDAPFRLQNKTGLELLVWPEGNDRNRPVSGVKRLDDGADVPWRFEDRKRTRDVSHHNPFS